MKILSICWGKLLSCSLAAAPSAGCGCLRGLYQTKLPVLSIASPVDWDIASTYIFSQWPCVCLLPSFKLNKIFSYHLFYGWYAETVLSEKEREHLWLVCWLQIHLNYDLRFQIYSHFSLACSLVANMSNSCMNDTIDMYVRILSNIKIIWIL